MPNKPIRRTIRLHGYDYSQQGLYYITVCAQDRARLFGEVMNGEMVLNEVGEMEINCRGVLHTPASTTDTTTGVFDTSLRS